jgi:hypothetical protein
MNGAMTACMVSSANANVSTMSALSSPGRSASQPLERKNR